MYRLIRNSLVMVLVMLLGACASQVTSEVTRFHQDSKPKGETIAITASDQGKQGSLEFAAYAKLVAKKLTEIGYQVVDVSAKPDLLARMDYAVGPAQAKVQSYPADIVYYRFNYGYSYPYSFGHYWDRPGFYNYWGEPRVFSYTVYPRTLDLNLVRANGESLFEGHVKSIGHEQNINQVMPYLVQAMFNNYPGESGVTKVVTIQKDGSTQPY